MSMFLHRAGLMIPPPLTSVSFHASAVASGNTALTVPATVQAGDILCFKDASQSDFGAGVVPSGFTVLAQAGSGPQGRIILSFKIAIGTEASTTLVGGTVSSVSRRELLVFRGNAVANAVTAHSPAGEVNSGNVSAQVITAASGVVPLIVLAGYHSNGTVDPRSFSPAKDAEVNANTNSYFAYKIYNSSPADVTVDMDDEGLVNQLASGYLQVT